MRILVREIGGNMERGHLRFLLSAVLLGAGCGPNGCAPAPAGPLPDLTFWQGSSAAVIGTPQNFLAAKVLAPQTTLAYGEQTGLSGPHGDLAQQSLPVAVSFTGVTPANSGALGGQLKHQGSETVLFAIDPDNFQAFLLTNGISALQAENELLWDQITDASLGDPTWPAGFSMQWPVAGGGPNNQVISVADFYPGFASGFAGGIGLEPKGESSIKSAYVYDHGACSMPYDLASLVQPQLDKVLPGLLAAPDTIDAILHWAKATNFLSHDDPTDPTTMHGGINVNFWVTLTELAGPARTNPKAEATYPFVLTSGGVLALDAPNIVYQDPMPACCPGCCVGDIGDQIRQQLEGVSPTANAAIADMQWFDVFGPRLIQGITVNPGAPNFYDVPDCNPVSKTDPCAAAEAALTGAVQRGAAALNISQSDTTSLMSVAGKRSEWQCRNESDSNGTVIAHRCHYFVPAKRALYFPDSIEAVWFDPPVPSPKNPSGLEATNAAFALWVALHDTMITDDVCGVGKPACFPISALTSALCSFDPTTVPTHRQWVSLSN